MREDREEIEVYLLDCLRYRQEEFSSLRELFHEFKAEDPEVIPLFLEGLKEEIINILCDLASLEHGVDPLSVREVASELDVTSVLYGED